MGLGSKSKWGLGSKNKCEGLESEGDWDTG